MKNNVYPCKPQFYYINVGFKGIKIIKACFRDEYMYECCLCLSGLPFFCKYGLFLRNIDTLSGEVNLSKLFYSLLNRELL